MKTSKFINIAVLIALVLGLGACKKFIDPTINDDPDSPSEVSMTTLLPGIEANMAFTTMGGNDMVRVQAQWIQQIDGIARQAQSETNYAFREGDVNNIWNTTYNDQGMDIYQLLKLAQEHKAPHFLGAAKVLMAMNIAQSSAIWGSMPYSEAYQGNENWTPKFDTQKELYESAQKLLSEAITELKKDPGIFPIEGDYLFGGDADAWVKFAYMLKARYTIHLSKVAPDWDAVLANLDLGFTSSGEDALMQFNDSPTGANPFYQFMRDRGDVRMNAFLINMLLDAQDPRLAVLANTVTVEDSTYYEGSVTGSANENASTPGSAIAGATTPVPFITYTEGLFMRAEANFQKGNDAKQDLLNAVEASLNYYGVFDQTWFDTYTAKVNNDINGADVLKEIFKQKYIALTYQTEAFNDFRRSNNILEIPVNANGQENEIPRRFPYATDAVTYNPNTPSGVSIVDRVWWDK